MGISQGIGIGSIKPGVCTSTTRPASPFVGQTIYETDTNRMLVWNGSSWNGVGRMKNVARFTTSGTWTVPTGVTYATAYMTGGGGGIGANGGAGGNGGNSSVAFAGGTVSATGGVGIQTQGNIAGPAYAGTANSGQGAVMSAAGAGTYYAEGPGQAQNGAYIVAGGAVTPAASITVTVGAGGTAGTSGAAGGTGYVYIEYEV